MPNSPIITATVRDVNSATIALTGNSSKLIRYCSTARASMTAEAQGGASIDQDLYIIRNGGETAYSDEHDFAEVESAEFVFSAEDSLGRSARQVQTVGMVEYIRLTCNIVESRINTDGEATIRCEGDFFNGSFGASSNFLMVRCRHRLSGGSWSSYRNMTQNPGDTGYEATLTITGLDYSKSYEFECSAEDALYGATDKTTKVKSKPIFHWSETDVAFETDVSVAGNVDVKGDLRLKGDGNYGNKLYFGDKSYCYIGELEDDKLSLNADSEINLVSDTVKINGESLYGEWTPTLSISSVEYTKQKGWYTKIGNVVTVGFYLKANCYPSTDIIIDSISGLPYTPYCQGSGGGICSGAQVAANKNFQCFVAETTGKITLRAQDCNGTIQDDLSTSASAFWYPINSVLTLSGTISYEVAE